MLKIPEILLASIPQHNFCLIKYDLFFASDRYHTHFIILGWVGRANFHLSGSNIVTKRNVKSMK